MAYAVKYRVEYKDYTGVDKKIEILLDGYAGAVIDVLPGDDPLTIEMAGTDTVFAPILATGATLDLISDSDMKLVSLFSIDPRTYMVKAWKTGAAAPFWLGWINTEGYREPYSTTENYSVNIDCNDGFAILKRFKFLDSAGDKYTGFASVWQVMSDILSKMGLPFAALGFASTIVPDGVTIAANETLFHKIYVNRENYYDESGDALDCLEVLEAILKPFPLQIRWHAGSLYIYEPQMLAAGSITFKMFGPSLAYTGTAALSRCFDISSGDAFWALDDQALSYVGGASKQKVRYSPYCHEEAAEYVDIQDSANWTGMAVWTTHYYDEGEKFYLKMSGITAVKGFTFSNNCYFSGRATVVGLRDSAGDDEYYFEIPYQNGAGTGLEAIRFTSDRHLIGVRGSCIKVSFMVYVASMANEFDDEDPHSLSSLSFSVAIKIGGKYANYVDGVVTWVDTFTKWTGKRLFFEDDGVCDNWLRMAFFLPWNLPAGGMELIFFDDLRAGSTYNRRQGVQLITDGVLWVRFKDFRFKIWDDLGYDGGHPAPLKPSDLSDVEFSGKINEAFENEATQISLIHGDGVNVADRGAILGPTLGYIEGWRKSGDTVSLPLSSIMLRSIVSQLQEVNAQLSGTVEAEVMLEDPDGFSFFACIGDTGNISGKFTCIGGVYSDFNRLLKGDFAQIREDLLIEIEE